MTPPLPSASIEQADQLVAALHTAEQRLESVIDVEREAEQEQHGNRRDDEEDIATGRIGLARAFCSGWGTSQGISEPRRDTEPGRARYRPGRISEVREVAHRP